MNTSPRIPESTTADKNQASDVPQVPVKVVLAEYATKPKTLVPACNVSFTSFSLIKSAKLSKGPDHACVGVVRTLCVPL